jgi:hypothetical protein
MPIDGSGVLAFPAIVDGAIAMMTFPLVGAVAGQQVVPGWPGALETGLAGTMLVSAADVIQVRLLNVSGAELTPASATFKASVGVGAVVGSAVLAFPAIVDGGFAVMTFTLAGAVPGQHVVPGWPATLEAGLGGTMRIIAPNTIEVMLSNWSGAEITPASQTFKAATL